MITTKLKLAVLFLAGNIFSTQAQIDGMCGQSQMAEQVKAKFSHLLQSQSVTNVYKQNSSSMATSTALPTFTIPIVFHILHTGGPENISDAQILDQVAILNRDFQKKNADTIQVVPSFTNNIANVGIEFRLAKIDPSGKCTNGIIRHFDPITNAWPFQLGNLSQYAYTWPPDKYLNVYVVGNILTMNGAYAILPSLPTPTVCDAIVIEHYVTGSIGTANVANSRVLTHECAHMFDILHVWGSTNNPGVACGDDSVFDTPITKGTTACNIANAAICNPPIIENVQNYMDYAPCKLMFTNGQKTRMHNLLNSTLKNRNNLWSAANLLATGITTTAANCIPLVDVGTQASKTLCVGNTIVINSFTSNANPTSYSWAVSPSLTVTNSSSANLTLTPNAPGIYTITCTAGTSFGNNNGSTLIYVMSNTVVPNSALVESFEGSSIPANWVVNGDNIPTSTWSLNALAGLTGAKSMFVNGESAPPTSLHLLETPAFNFLANQGASFTFNYAYARQSTAHVDFFKVQASKNCGGTWEDIFVPNPSTLGNGSGGVTSTLFVPAPNQWKFHDLTQNSNFFSYLSAPNVRIRFYFKSDTVIGYGNRFYLDDVNFTTPVSVKENMLGLNLQVFPNPTSNKLTIKVGSTINEEIKFTLLDIAGKQVQSDKIYLSKLNESEFEILGLANLGKGLYFLNLIIDGNQICRKVIID